MIDVPASTTATTAASTLDDAVAADSKDQKGSYVGVHSTGFRDFLLKPELLRAISDMGFEHPSEVQQECIPQAILGMDVLCQAKSGMGKSTVPFDRCLRPRMGTRELTRAPLQARRPCL